MSGLRLLKVRLSLKGRPIKTYTFKQDTIMVGRSPEADIFLDNPGVSREHFKLEMTPRGYYAVEDLGSANGTYLNDQPVKREYLMNNDVIRVGKFSIWVSYDEDRRGNPASGALHPSPAVFEGTTVLSAEEIDEMITISKESERRPEPSPAMAWDRGEPRQGKPRQGKPRQAESATSRGPSKAFLGVLVLLSFLLGGLLGSTAVMKLLG